MNWEEIEKMSGLERKNSGRENLEEAMERARKFLEKIKIRKDEEILIVSHHGFLSCFWYIITGEDFKKIILNSLDYPLDFRDGAWLEI